MKKSAIALKKNRPEIRPVEKIPEQMITFPEGDT